MNVNIWVKILIVFLIVVSLIGLAKDKVIEVSVERVFSFVLGTEMRIDSMKVGIFRPVVDIKGLKLYSPGGYNDILLADVPTIYVDYRPFSLIQGKIHLNKLDFYLKELNIVRNANGTVNVDQLKPIKDKSDGARMEKQDKGKIPDIDIAVLRLRADKVFYRNYSKGTPPVVKEFNVDLDETYNDISDPYTLVRLIMYRVLKKTAIADMVKIPMKEVSSILSGTVGQAAGTANKLVRSAGSRIENTAENIGGLFKGMLSPGSSSAAENTEK